METEPSKLFNIFLADSKFNVLLFVLMLLLVVLSAFFSMSETAYTTASDTKLRVDVEEKRRGAKKAVFLFEHYDRTLTTLLIGNNLVNVALSTIAVIFFTQLALDENIVGVVSTAVVTVVLLIFGEIVPKMIAKLYPEKICCGVSLIIYLLTYILFPFVALFVGIQKLILSHQKEDTPAIEKEELEVILKELKDSGEIEKDEAETLKNVLDLKDRSVEDIMVPRIKMSAIDFNLTTEEVKDILLRENYTRFPVYKKDTDHIEGVIHERDFFTGYIKNKNMNWHAKLKDIKFVSKTMKADNLIKELQASKTHMAIVIGEYGETVGLVTMEDALEEMIGEIYDEHDVLGEDDIRFEQQEDGSYIVDGEIFVDDLFDKLEIGDIPEDIPSKLSGWVLENCESLPEIGYSFSYLASYTKEIKDGEYEDYNKILTFTIEDVKDRAIDLIKIEIRDATEEEIEEYEED